MAHGHKTGGRTAGTPNKLTATLKSRIAALLDTQFDSVVEDLDALEPKERVTAYLKLLEYAVPKLTRTEQINTEKRILFVRRDEENGDVVIETVEEPE